MLLCKLAKDGGEESRVWGFYFIEIKHLLSIVLLHFKDGSREAYHNHAFHALSWVLKGRLDENLIDGTVKTYTPGLKPIFTGRDTFHKVVSAGDTWALTLRGPWRRSWKEFLPLLGKFQTLSWGRKITGSRG